jgi:CysZ protein
LSQVERDFPEHERELGAFTGLRALVGGARFILRTPQIWIHALIPSVVLVVLVAVAAWFSFSWFGPLVGSLISAPTTWYEKLGADLLRYLGAILATTLGALVALAVTPPLCGPALERIVVAQERAWGVPERPDLSLFQEFLCGIRAQACAAAFALPLLTLLWVIDFVIPVAAIVTTLLKFVVAAFALAWNMFDYALTLRGVPMRDRVRLVMRHKAVSFGFGASFVVLFLVPCCAVILLPVGVAAGARTLWTILAHDPEALPRLPRYIPPRGTGQL